MCRQARHIELDDGSTLRYDLLVLTPGLQNATLAAVKAGGVGGVCSADELQAHLTAADAEALEGVLVYGDTLAAVSALTALAQCGVDPAQAVLHLTPPGTPGAGVDVLREVRRLLFKCELEPQPVWAFEGNPEPQALSVSTRLCVFNCAALPMRGRSGRCRLPRVLRCCNSRGCRVRGGPGFMYAGVAARVVTTMVRARRWERQFLCSMAEPETASYA